MLNLNKFARRILIGLTLWMGMASGQNPNTAVYPGSVATDSDLLVAANRASSTLSTGINSSTLTIPVTSSTPFIVPTMVTVGDEYIKICTKAAGQLNACTGGRGFDSSTAAIHSSGVTVSANITRYFFNQLAAEIKAVETAIVLNPMTTLGDTIYGGASGVQTRLAGNTTITKKFLSQTGDGVNSAAPGWATIVAGDVPTLNQSTTGNAATATALAANPTEVGCSATTPTTVTAIDVGANLTCTSIQVATDSLPGILSAADHTTFNAKQPAGDYITAAANLTSVGNIPRVSASGILNLSKLSITGGALTLFDDTAITGTTNAVIKAGAGQTSHLLAFKNNADAIQLAILNTGSLQVINAGAGIFQLGAGGFASASASTLAWYSGADINGAGSYDIFVGRSGAKALNITSDSGLATYDVTVRTGTVDMVNGVLRGHVDAIAVTAPSTPPGGFGSFYVDSTSKNLAVKDDAGVVKHGVQTITCTSQFVSAINDAGLPTCSSVASAKNRQINLIATSIGTTGVKACADVEVAYTIVGAHLISDALPTGANLTVDVTKVAFASYTGTAAGTSITASATPHIDTTDSNPRYSDTTLTGWTTSISADDVVCVKITTAPTGGATWAALTLEVQ